MEKNNFQKGWHLGKREFEYNVVSEIESFRGLGKTGHGRSWGEWEVE